SALTNTSHLTTCGDSMTASGTGFGDMLSANFFGVPFFNGGVGGETSTQIKTRMIAAADKYGDVTVIEIGRNDPRNGNATVLSNIATIVAALTTPRYVIVSVFNGEYPAEYQGQADYISIMQLNASIAAAYPNNYIDSRSYIVSQGTNTGQDAIDLSHDITPASLRADNIHLNGTGNALHSAYIASWIRAKGWLDITTTPLTSQGILNTRTGDNSTTAPSIITATLPFALTSGAWAFDITIKAKLNSASISTPQYAFGTYVDASNYTALLIDSTTATFRKRIAGVNYDATKALTMVAGTNYKLMGRVNVDNTTDIFVQGVKGAGNANTTAPQAKSDKTYQIGSDGASANQLYAGIISSGI